jgi:hypothetical protein
MIYHQHGIVKNLKIKLNKYKNMKENINEHDMTKKMMDIIRNSQKPLIKEADEVPAPMAEPQNAMVPGDDLPEEEPEMAASPTDNSAEPLEGFELDNTYVQMDKDDQRYKDLSSQLLDTANAQVTSIYISSGENGKEKDLVITGMQNGLIFTMSLNVNDVKLNGTSSANDTEGPKLQGFRDNLNANMKDTKQYLYDDKLDDKKGF